jgi:hypothetical protein
MDSSNYIEGKVSGRFSALEDFRDKIRSMRDVFQDELVLSVLDDLLEWTDKYDCGPKPDDYCHEW